VSLLPRDLDRFVREIWDELKTEFGFDSVFLTPFPHITYCIVEERKTKIDPLIEAIASNTPPLIARTEYLGVFSGEKPVIFIGLARNSRLASLHHALWTELCDSVDNRAIAYNEIHWIPHITVVFGDDLNRSNIGPVMERLAFKDFHHELTIDNLTILEEVPGEGIVIREKLRLAGPLEDY
jgi:2'-5' RNA ligase